MSRTLVASFTAILVAACTTTSFEDAPPGRNVLVKNNVISNLSPFPGGGHTVWMRAQLVVPEGTQWCRSGRTWPPLVAGPQREGAPNAKNEVMLTIDRRATQAHFECRTRTGMVSRTIDVVKFDVSVKFNCPSCSKIGREFPPIVHIGKPDAQADARWVTLEQALCFDAKGVRSTLDRCRPDVFAQLKARDLADG